MDSEQGKLFVGGLPWEATEDRIKDYFSSFGEVLDVVIMKDRLTGRARGFGFVLFADPAVADRVLLDKHTIDGRPVETKKAVRREENQNMPRGGGGGAGGNQASGQQFRTKKIFVGGLASTVTEEDFRSYFEQFGVITDVVVMYDHNTQRHRGFGFITFDSEDAVERVLQKTFHELSEKTVEVKRAIPKDQAGGGSQSGRGGMTGNFGGAGGRGGGMPYNGQSYGSRPGSGGGYPAPPTGRGAYPPPNAAYGPGYGVTGGYPAAPGYSAPGYGATMMPYGGGYGATQGVNGYGNVAGGGGYGGAPGSRSPWGAGGGNSNNAGGGGGFGGPTNYGATSGGAPSSGYGYGAGESGYGSAQASYGGPPPPAQGGMYGNSPVVSSAGYVDGYYGNSVHGSDPSWRGDAHTSNSPAVGGYGANNVPASDGSMNGANYGGYDVAGKQTQRGPDPRFRPYSTTG